MSSYLDELNEVQRKAVVTTDGPVLVVAGPGSGKTRVLTYRIAHIIEKGTPPWEILSLTFTNKAAREMKERISKVVGDRANRVYAGTFHSIFARILRSEASKIGYPSNFTIYDSDDSKNLISTIIKELHLDGKVYNANAMRSKISSCKSNLITPKLYVQTPEMLEKDRVAKKPHFHKIYTEYVNRCKRAGAMDFDDLLFRLFELLQKNPDNVLEKYRQRFKYILVDEFQDTNFLQYSIIKKLVKYPGSKANICVVGDDAQSIYGFRGATIQNILDYEKDFKVDGIQVFKLEQNYRSTDHIVKAANEVISVNKNQIKKTIWSDKGDGSKIQVIKAMTDSEEGKRVADAIMEQKIRHHLSNKEIAILYRTNAQSRVFEEYLRRFNIPYRIYGGLSFYQRKEVKDLISYMRLVINPADDEALKRVINFPKRGIGKTSIDKIAFQANAIQQPMWVAIDSAPISAKAKNTLLDFKKMLTMAAQKAKTGTAYEVATFVARQSGLIDHFKNDTSIEGLGRLENVNSLLDGINEFVEGDILIDIEGEDEDRSLPGYLQNIALVTDFDAKEQGDNVVTLMSVHSAKGLEFKSVFCVGLEEKLFPSFMSLDSPEQVAEERRLFYVAITRAEQILTLSFATSRYQHGSVRYNSPSRFLEEIGAEHFDGSVSLSASPHQAFGASNNSNGGYRASTAKKQNTSSRISGNFKRIPKKQLTLKVDPSTFKPSPMGDIKAGMRVLHMKFGEGQVVNVDGSSSNPIATIRFTEMGAEDKRIMLKFAKLQILNS